MSDFFQAVFSLLINSPGNLAYHLVLAFSIAGALLVANSQRSQDSSSPWRRMVFGLGFLLLLRVLLFTAAALVWQGLISDQLVLPLVDRAVNLLSVIVIVWLWAFPIPNRFADAAVVLLVLLALTFFVFSQVWITATPVSGQFNGALVDRAYAVAVLTLLLLGAIVLVFRQPPSWGIGLGMLILLFLGDLFHLLLPLPLADYPGAVRLAEMAAYPLLLTLPLRFSSSTAARSSIPIDPNMPTPGALNTYLALAVQPNWDAFCQQITSAFAHAYGVDICLLFSPIASNQRVACECGHNAHSGETIPRFSVSDADIPHLLDALAAGSAVALDRAHHFDDFITLETALGLPECDTLFIQPVLDESAKALAALVFLSPFTQAVLSPQDHAYLQAGSLQMARLLHHTIGNFVLKQELRDARQGLLTAKADQGGMVAENRMLREEIAKTQVYQPDRYQDDESLDELLSAHEEAQKIISRLRVENIRLLGLLKLTGAGELSEPLPGEPLGTKTIGEDQMPEIDDELRVALLEVAHLQSVLEEADRSILDLRRQREFEKLSIKNQEQVFTLTRDLRQSLSAIIGYSDFLLDESVGILGSLQRKFLERVKTSAERMSTQVDEIIAITNSEIAQLQRSPDHTDIYAAVDSALKSAGRDIRQKEISLRVDLQDDLPDLRLDTLQIERCLGILLSNAGSVTPAQGEITLKVVIDHADTPGDHVLFQVADQGEGIAPELLPSLFTQPASSDLSQLDGVSVDLAGLVELQAIVSDLHGRLWVESTLGTGSVFSILIPYYLDELASPESE